MKKPVHLSNLAIRFYISDGWTKEELEPLLIKGELVNIEKENIGRDYYLLKVGGAFDVKKLAGKISKVYHTFEDHKKDTLEEIIEHFNW